MEAAHIGGFSVCGSKSLFRLLSSRSASLPLPDSRLGLKSLTIPSNLAAFDSLLSTAPETAPSEPLLIRLTERLRAQVKGKTVNAQSVVECVCEGGGESANSVTFGELPPFGAVVLGPTVTSSVAQLKGFKELKFSASCGPTRLFTAHFPVAQLPVSFQADFLQSSLKVYITVRGTVRRFAAKLATESLEFERIGRLQEGLKVSLLSPREAVIEARAIVESTSLEIACKGLGGRSLRLSCSFEADELAAGQLSLQGKRVSVARHSVCHSLSQLLTC